MVSKRVLCIALVAMAVFVLAADAKGLSTLKRKMKSSSHHHHHHHAKAQAKVQVQVSEDEEDSDDQVVAEGPQPVATPEGKVLPLNHDETEQPKLYGDVHTPVIVKHPINPPADGVYTWTSVYKKVTKHEDAGDGDGDSDTALLEKSSKLSRKDDEEEEDQEDELDEDEEPADEYGGEYGGEEEEEEEKKEDHTIVEKTIVEQYTVTTDEEGRVIKKTKPVEVQEYAAVALTDSDGKAPDADGYEEMESKKGEPKAGDVVDAEDVTFEGEDGDELPTHIQAIGIINDEEQKDSDPVVEASDVGANDDSEVIVQDA